MWLRHRSLATLAIGFTLVGGSLAGSVPTEAQLRATYGGLLKDVSLANIRQTYADVSAFGSRLTGSTGEAKTLDYVEQKFRDLGLQEIHREKFTVSIPDPDAMGSLRWGNRHISLYPLWPNLARTSSCHLSGPLIYGGTGSLEALRGKDVKGTIVLLEFNSGPRWRNAARLGAKAIVFLEPTEMPRAEAEAKFASVPLDMPRFYLPMAVAGPALNAARNGDTVKLDCEQKWIKRDSANLIAEMPGRDRSASNEPVVLMAYADSMSVAPGLAPGAEAISGPASLVELARVYRNHDHRRPLRFVLSGAHGLGLQGAREYVEKRIVQPEAPTFVTVTLDLTSGAPTVGSYGRGWFYEYRDESQQPLQTISRLLRAHGTLLAKIDGIDPPRLVFIDAVNNGDSRTWKNNISGKFAFDCEPLVDAGVTALTFATVEDSRPKADTPVDTLSRVAFANVHRQVQTVAVMLNHVLNDTSDRSEPSDFKIPVEPRSPSRSSLIGGFAVVDGQVVYYDPQKSFVPDSPVPDSLAGVLGRQKSLMGVRGDILQLTSGANASFHFVGLAPVSAYSDTTSQETRLVAFHFDKKGDIDYAATQSGSGTMSFSTEFKLLTSEHTSPIVVFHCVPTTLYDMVDPQELKALQRVWVIDAQTGSSPLDYGTFTPGSDQRLNPEIEDTQVLFTMPGQRYRMIAASGSDFARLIITNSSVGDEEGRGFRAPGDAVDADPPKTSNLTPTEIRANSALDGYFPNTALNAALDIMAINDSRIARFKKYRIISASMSDLQAQAHAEAKLAQEAIDRKDWPAADQHAHASWGYALRAHPVIQATANDVVNGVVFYLFLLIPFSYFLERLMVGNQLLTKQLSWSIGIFIASFLVLRLIHPAFEIVSNPFMIFVAFVMGVLSLIVISFILGKFESSLRAVQKEQSGVHEVDIRRSSVAMAAFNLGVSNMRRRKARTVLTTLTLVVMTFIVLSFTSIVSELSLTETASPNSARYPGLLMRNPGLEPMQLATYRKIQSEFAGAGVVARRAYYYGADIGDTGVLTLQRADRVAEVRAMIGLDPVEDKVLQPQQALLPGGRWFRPGERDVMILPQPLAETLKVESTDVGSAKVTYAGTAYTVIGIVDPGILRALSDLDGDGLMPPDFTLSKQYQEAKSTTNSAFRSYLRLDPATIFILPAESAMALGADLRNVAVAFPDPGYTRKALTALMPRLRLNLYASVPSATVPSGPLEVKQFSVLQASKGSGMGLVIVQLLIASVFVLNTMVATVFERTREIGIFSSIGLAPNHIAMLFFAESTVYGVLGAVIGYYVAQATAKVIVATGAFPGLTLNFSSTSAVLSAVLVMAVVLGSTIYPARKASQIAAPAMNEEVFETEPTGDDWQLPLPFSISEAEAGPLTAFLGEWLRAYEGYTIGDFVTKGTLLSSEKRAAGDRFQVTTTSWLAPYDLGICQQLTLVASPSPVPGVYLLDLTLHRISGDPENWPVVNRRFLANLRKQFLTWRTLNRDQRAKYEAMSNEELMGQAAAV